VIIAYNQERYIKEAIEGAFAQTYSPLEIILSDDHSSDSTFEIMQREAEKYTGPHQVILNRNPMNRGIAGHINRIMALAHGEMIVIAAGDDISLSIRVEKIENIWAENDYKIMSIHSAFMRIDSVGNELGVGHHVWKNCFNDLDILVNKHLMVQGSTHAWHKSVFDVFGDLDEEIINEDIVIPFRSALLGSVQYISEPLIEYRVDVGVSYEMSELSFKEKMFGLAAERTLVVAIQKYHDLIAYKSNHRLLADAKVAIKKQEFIISLQQGTVASKLTSLRMAMNDGVGVRSITKIMIYYYLPRLSVSLYLLKRKLSNK
jgi:glycosyltransferase involved in cell wall biosynthesis